MDWGSCVGWGSVSGAQSGGWSGLLLAAALPCAVRPSITLHQPLLSSPPCCQAKQNQMLQDRRKAEEERLLAALSGNLGFHRGRPLAAIVVFRCCLQWRAFQVRI